MRTLLLQIGRWVGRPHSLQSKSNQCQRSHRMFEQKGPLETISFRFYFIRGVGGGGGSGLEKGKDLFRSQSW